MPEVTLVPNGQTYSSWMNGDWTQLVQLSGGIQPIDRDENASIRIIYTNLPEDADTINSITVNNYVRIGLDSVSGNCRYYVNGNTYGMQSYTYNKFQDTNWYTNEYLTSLKTGLQWTVSEINSMEILFNLFPNTNFIEAYTRIIQSYITVNYNESLPEGGGSSSLLLII